MDTTGVFTTHHFNVGTVEVDKPIRLRIFGDVHRDSPMHDSGEWQSWLEESRKDKSAIFLGMGDYSDLASGSERKIIYQSSLHESTEQTIEDLTKKMADDFCKEIGFMKGRLIGLIEGNHYSLFKNRTTTTQYMADKLHAAYLGVSSFIRLSFHRKSSGSRTCLDIWAHHGKGAARFVGSSLNRVEQMAESAIADIYVMGHDHKKGAVSGVKLFLQGGGDLRLRQKKQVYVRSGSFLLGYKPGKASYVVDAAMRPNILGAVTVTLKPKRLYPGSDKNGNREDWFHMDMETTS